MGWALGSAVYFVVWWTMLFSVLPFGIRSQREGGEVVPGSDPGAPQRPWLGRKLLINTAVSAVVWLGVDYAYVHFYLAVVQ
jgi:predicted secreted protein